MIATLNAKKQAELTRIFAPRGLRVITPDVLGITLPNVEETENTFAGNALLKARSACALSRIPCVADDSGLCVDALSGAPGVYSARYAGEHGNDGGNMELLLAKLRGVPPEERTARFVCAAACVYPDGTELLAEGRCEGTIALELKGSGGFGYDPVFLPQGMGGRSMAELTAGEKDTVSHRGRALYDLQLLMHRRGH
ncbi:MAG: RdgB/HAM1 family non-canonical purine NTP pyrophosphatase [Oscillospiraceae bacterium]|nr:RdgB/HAM1 family non-canonical purine NTP pyrophosphatase [Oscillospiraceae bacterium]